MRVDCNWQSQRDNILLKSDENLNDQSFFVTLGLAGDVHFDADEPFAVNSNDSNKVDFGWISLHELGHSLGVDHSLDVDSVMFPLYIGRIEDLELAFDDQEGIQQLYGEKWITNFVACVAGAWKLRAQEKTGAREGDTRGQRDLMVSGGVI